MSITTDRTDAPALPVDDDPFRLYPLHARPDAGRSLHIKHPQEHVAEVTALAAGRAALVLPVAVRPPLRSPGPRARIEVAR